MHRKNKCVFYARFLEQWHWLKQYNLAFKMLFELNLTSELRCWTVLFLCIQFDAMALCAYSFKMHTIFDEPNYSKWIYLHYFGMHGIYLKSNMDERRYNTRPCRIVEHFIIHLVQCTHSKLCGCIVEGVEQRERIGWINCILKPIESDHYAENVWFHHQAQLLDTHRQPIKYGMDLIHFPFMPVS